MSIERPLQNLMVVWGVPGSGKSHFARWLVANKGYAHAETDAGLQAALEQASVALERGRPAVIEWGVYVEPNAIGTVRQWRDQGADPWWFDADPRAAAFHAWKLENRRRSRSFNDKKWYEVVDVIVRNWHLVEHFFGPDRILYPVTRARDGGPQHLKGEEIDALMKERRGKAP